MGTGGFADFKYGNSSAIVKLKDHEVLIDCGNVVYSTLRRKNLENSFKYVLITHLHDDHVGSLSSLLIHRFKFKGAGPINIIYPDEEFKNELRALLTFSLGPNPEAIFNWIHIDEIDGIVAIDTFGKHIPGMRSYSYYFVEYDEILAYSGDVANGDILYKELEKYSANRNITVFHEITFGDDDIKVHTSYKKLEKYKNIGEIYGYHCDPTKRPVDLKIPLVFDHKEFLF